MNRSSEKSSGFFRNSTDAVYLFTFPLHSLIFPTHVMNTVIH